MRWSVHSKKPLYEDEWLDIRVADVELPDGRHLEHRLIRTPPGAGCVVVLDGQALLLWRHRFITGSQGWEIPIGKIEPGEDPAAAAAREPRKRPGGGRGTGQRHGDRRGRARRDLGWAGREPGHRRGRSGTGGPDLAADLCVVGPGPGG
jgi:hypothetical protein